MKNIKFIDKDNTHYAFVSEESGKGRKTVYRINADDNSVYMTDTPVAFSLIERASTQKEAEDILTYFEEKNQNDGTSIGGFDTIDAIYEDPDVEDMIAQEDDFVFVELIRRAKETKARKAKAEEHVYCTNCIHFKCSMEEDCFGEYDMIECEYEDECNLLNFEDSMPFSERPKYQERREMEIGNMLFGHSRGTYPVEPRTEMQEIFTKFLENIGFDEYGYPQEKDKRYNRDMWKSREETDHCTAMENDVCIIRPYYWGEEDEPAKLANFEYKPEGIEIKWYKYPMRDSYSNVMLSPEKLRAICRNSRKGIANE